MRRLGRIVCVVVLAVVVSGCRDRSGAKAKPMIYKSAEEAKAHVQSTKISGERFELPISNEFTFGGQPDSWGAGMAVVLDAILAQGYGPDGFEQRDGYRVYRYKPLSQIIGR